MKSKPIFLNKIKITLYNFKKISAPLFLIIPATVFGILMVLPLFYLILRVWQTDFDILSLLLRPQTFIALLNSLGLALTVTVSSILIAVPLGWLTVRSDLPGKKIWSILTMVPLVIPSLVGGYTFVSAFGQGGLFHRILQQIINIEYFPDIYGFPGAWLVLTLICYPYILLSVRSALKGIDQNQIEAARVLGKTPWQTFWKITLPQLKPAITAGSLLVALYTLSDFAAVSMLHFDTFTRIIYLEYQTSFNRVYASVLALILVILTIILVTFELWFRGKARYHNVGCSIKRELMEVPLKKWKLPALIFCSIIVFFSLFLPIGVSSYWLISGLKHGERLMLRAEAVINSLQASGITAIISVFITLPIAILASRYQSRLSNFLEKLSYTGYALPGIVVALSLVFFGANYTPFLYQTLPLLIFAYIILFLPQALGTLRSSLLQLNPNIEDAGLTLGCSHFKILRCVILPVIRPGILSGAALVFLTVMKELPATLLLSPIGFRTLTTEIWNATSEAFYTRAAGPALLLIFISSLSLWLLFKQEK